MNEYDEIENHCKKCNNCFDAWCDFYSCHTPSAIIFCRLEDYKRCQTEEEYYTNRIED